MVWNSSELIITIIKQAVHFTILLYNLVLAWLFSRLPARPWSMLYEMERIRIHSDHTDVYVILIFWVRKLSIMDLVQMEKWDGTVLNINDIVAALGDRSLQLLGMHAVTCCDTVSYPFNKGKLTALSKLREGNFPELYSVVGEETATLEDLLKTGQTSIAALYGQWKCTS